MKTEKIKTQELNPLEKEVKKFLDSFFSTINNDALGKQWKRTATELNDGFVVDYEDGNDEAGLSLFIKTGINKAEFEVISLMDVSSKNIQYYTEIFMGKLKGLFGEVVKETGTYDKGEDARYNTFLTATKQISV